MTKKEILDNIQDADTKKNVSEILDFVESTAKSGLKKEEVTAEIAETVKNLKIKTESIEGLNDFIEAKTIEISKAVKDLQENGKKTEKTLKEIIKENAETMLKEMDGMGGKFTMKIPTSAIAKTAVTASSFTSDTRGIYLDGFGRMKTAKTKIAGLFSQFPIGPDSNGIIYYTDQTTATRNAAARSAGNAAGESVIAWTCYNKTLESISDSIPMHKEVLSRQSQLEAEIRNFIETNLLLKEDSYLVSGTGTTPQIKGIYTYATAFDSAAYTGLKISKAALMDLIVVMATEIEKDSSYICDTVIINPADALGLTLEKSEDGVRMNIQMLNVDGTMSIRNIKVITSASQAINTLTIGDFTRARRYYGENITLEFGYNASGDFTKRIITLLGNMEELLLVRNCEADAFLKSTDVATDITNITAAVN